MNEAVLQCVVAKALLEKGHQFVVPNKILGKYESDLCSVNRKSYLSEFEIKTSQADFKNEAKNKKKKHHWLTTGRIAQYKPNYYWFVCPEEVIQPGQVNEKYGLMWVSKGKLKVMKRARKLHANTVDEKLCMQLARALSYKIFNRFGDLLLG